MLVSGFDLNVERQTCDLLRCYAKDRYAPGHARVFAAHGVLPLSTFRRCVAVHRGEHKVKDFSCLDPFLSMSFAQLTYRESLRDIEVNLRTQAKRLHHMGFRCQTISRNTLANANATRPWQIYADFAQHLIGMARPLYANKLLGIDLDATVYAFDAITVVTLPLFAGVFSSPLQKFVHVFSGHQL